LLEKPSVFSGAGAFEPRPIAWQRVMRTIHSTVLIRTIGCVERIFR
jgi:hypothetical protein